MGAAGDGAHPLHVLMHVMGLPTARIPLLLHLHRCAPPQVNITFLVQNADLAQCAEYCHPSNTLRTCNCLGTHGAATRRAHPLHRTTHRTLAKFATGKSHLLYVHGDMWVNIATFMRQQFYQSGRIALTPSNRAADGFLSDVARPAAKSRYPSEDGDPIPNSGPDCVPLELMQNCSAVPHWCGPQRNHYCPRQRCGQHAWLWWQRSHESCPAAASNRLVRGRVRACCIGWSDLIFLPASMHRTFRVLAGVFAGVFHEVALPTILNALPALSRDHSAQFKSLSCAGSCCGAIDLRADWMANMCAHRVALQNISLEDERLRGRCVNHQQTEWHVRTAASVGGS